MTFCIGRREFITLLGGAAAWPLATRAQKPATPVVGFLSSGQPQVFAHMIDAFRQGLNETGYIVGQNVAFEHRAAGSQYDRFRAMALTIWFAARSATQSPEIRCDPLRWAAMQGLHR
jgi:hypothetical protein